MTAQEGTREKLVQDLMTLVMRCPGSDPSHRRKSGGKIWEELLTALEKLKVTCLRIEECAAATVRNADFLIRDNPYHAVGVAFGLGLLVGVLVRRQ